MLVAAGVNLVFNGRNTGGTRTSPHADLQSVTAPHSVLQSVGHALSLPQLCLNPCVTDVHAYERTFPVSGGASDPAHGIPHVTIGDGGNREQFAYPWVPAQPEWSALREYAYGWGTLAVNRTHASWTWLRNDDPWNPPGDKTGDRVVYALRDRPRAWQ